MKWSVLCLFLSTSLLAQTTSVSGTHSYDLNGNRVLESESRQVVSAKGDVLSTSQMMLTINGNIAPLEKIEEKILSKTDTTKVVERTVIPYDANGNPGQPQRVITTERKNADGSSSVDRAVYYSDINGGFALAEKEIKVSRPTGANGSTYEKTVVRTTQNGEEVIERQQGRIVSDKASSSEEVAIERRDLSGNLQPAGRISIQKEEKDGVVKESKAIYFQEGGQVRLANQTLSETIAKKDGSSITKVNVFGSNSPGRPATDAPEFREQQIIEKVPGPNKSVSETISVRRPTLDGGGTLGPILKLSERNCIGQCNTP